MRLCLVTSAILLVIALVALGWNFSIDKKETNFKQPRFTKSNSSLIGGR